MRGQGARSSEFKKTLENQFKKIEVDDGKGGLVDGRAREGYRGSNHWINFQLENVDIKRIKTRIHTHQNLFRGLFFVA